MEVVQAQVYYTLVYSTCMTYHNITNNPKVSVVVTLVSTLNSSRSGSTLLLLLVVSIIVVVLTSIATKVIIERHATIELPLKK